MSREDLARLREQLINERRNRLNKAVSSLERKLFNAIFDKLISELDASEGVILSNNKNIDLVATLDKIEKEFARTEYLKVIKLFAGDLKEIGDKNKEYFQLLSEDRKEFDKIARDVEKILSKRIGLSPKGEVIKDGYLDRLIKDPTLQNKVKEATYKAVTTGQRMSDYKKHVQLLVVGNDKVNGGLQKHFNTFVYDTYQQFDRANSNLFAKKVGVQAFIYAGGKIKSSRPFCRDRDGKVFTTEEAETWKTLEFDGKPKDNYDPLIDLGGHGCRHRVNYISNQEAIRRRPDLKDKL